MRLSLDRYGDGDGPPLAIAHGLFGARRNWASLAKRLAKARPVLALDLRNHGDSPRDPVHDYPALAADLAETLAAEAPGGADLLGHSMGGKAAMALALTAPETVRRLIVADIAPVAYDHAHGDYLAAMRGVDLARVARRSDAEPMLADAVPSPALRAFILQNLVIGEGPTRWRPNLDALAAHMEAILGFPERLPHARFAGPTLFLHGALSDYVGAATHDAIRARFPAARIEAIAGAGHWLHADRPEAFLAAVERFLADS
jgi:pimeloyl-ACP methyl ester carboxylesterase